MHNDPDRPAREKTEAETHVAIPATCKGCGYTMRAGSQCQRCGTFPPANQVVTETCPTCGSVNDADKEHSCGTLASAALSAQKPGACDTKETT